MRHIPAGIVLGVLACQLLACSQPAQVKELAAEPRPTVVLTSIETLRVELDHPVMARNARGESATWDSAYMVRLALEMANIPISPAFTVFVGDHRIGELGGWKGGVYFYVYDPELLKQLAGGELFYRIGREQRQSLDARLEVDDLEEIRSVREHDLFPNRRATDR